MAIGAAPLPAVGHAAASGPPAPLLSDDFTHDSALNASLWQINGTVGSAFGSANCAFCTPVALAPSFSTAGMEIAQVDGNLEVGTIQSIVSFTPPLTATAVVEGTVSNGHPFVFGISSNGAASGVQITGNLNPDDCSALTGCGNPSTCGTSAAPSIAPNQCYYGIYARVGGSNGTWTKTPRLNLTPAIGLVYTLGISVDASGLAQYNVSEGGQVLGQSTVQVGTGPFYLILAQSEGSPVPGPGPNEAYWLSVALTPTSPSPAAAPSSWDQSTGFWLALVGVLAAAVVIGLLVVGRRRRRALTVTVLDSGTSTPIAGAGVAVVGPKMLSGQTGADGRIAFGGMKSGDYSIGARASGYAPSVPVMVSVPATTRHMVRLDPAAVGLNRGPDLPTAPAAPVPPPAGPPPSPSRAVPSAPESATAIPTETPPPLGSPPTGDGLEGWGGERIREIAETFRAKGALSPETALTADELGLSRIFVRIMKRRRGRTRIFVEIDGRYYLDEKAFRGPK